MPSARSMLERLVCLVRRSHNYAVRRKDGQMYLLCRRCSVQTPGWDVGAQARYKPAQPAQPPLRLLLDATGPQLIPELHPELIPKSDDAAHPDTRDDN